MKHRNCLNKLKIKTAKTVYPVPKVFGIGKYCVFTNAKGLC